MTCVENVCTLHQALATAFRDWVCFVTVTEVFDWEANLLTLCGHKWPHDVCVLLKEGMLPKMMWHNSERLPVD